MQRNGFNFNPFLESASDAEFNKFIRSNSPPPTFQFLRDAEDKFCRRFMEENDHNSRDHDDDVSFQVDQNLEVSSSSKLCKDEETSGGPFITLIFPKNSREVQPDQHHVQPSSSSQVLPLTSSSILKLQSNRLPHCKMCLKQVVKWLFGGGEVGEEGGVEEPHQFIPNLAVKLYTAV
ncbi:hypothetical protein HAX54_008802 [Datura stramonium]|uniref:Uncharacterized protein n=1 Tax=Datura stramonium TaxID=4076 RepID=A0ABS8TFL9_DATST|nr:hypothetical protein [Datura stramonium]